MDENADMPLWEVILLSIVMLFVCAGIPMLIIFYVIHPIILGMMGH